jgi:hypothetical protein
MLMRNQAMDCMEEVSLDGEGVGQDGGLNDTAIHASVTAQEQVGKP